MTLPTTVPAWPPPRLLTDPGGRVPAGRGRARVRTAAASNLLATGPWFFFLLLHAPIAAAIKVNVYFATAHAVATVAFGLACVSRSRTPERVLYVMGYIVASEPLWRVGHAMVFYESAKYSVAGLSILALLRFGLWRRADKTPLVYFLLLLPSLLVLPSFDRTQISFNMSGPFSLAMGTLFLSSLRLSPQVLRKLFLATLAPILGFAVLATFSTVTAVEAIDFMQTKIATAGLGNNQASSIFGLGMLLSFLYVFVARRPRLLRWFVAGSGLWCAVQGALSFSRGGIVTAVGAMAAASFFLLRDRRSRGALVVRVGLILLIAVNFAVPFLTSYTNGGFEHRFTSSHLTGRDKIIKADMIAFEENPLLGVGPGNSKNYHALTFGRASTHTEYSRLLAEHGILGLVALVLIVWMAVKRLRRNTSPAGMALAASFTVWSLLFMFHAAMRMAASSFIFALGAALLMDEGQPAAGAGRRGRQPPWPPRTIRRGPGRDLV